MASLQSLPDPLPSAAEPSRTNWAGNYTFRARSLVAPASVVELQAILSKTSEVKAVGTRHSFNHIADTEGTQIDLTAFKEMSLDEVARTVTVGAGVRYGELAPWLHAQGFAVHNLASLPHISVAGACATATHGSGLGNGCLSTAVRALEMVNGNGYRVAFSREADPEVFGAAAVHLGALGVVTSVTLDVVPTFEVAQTVYENLSFDYLQQNLASIFGAGYSVSLFTDWQQPRATQVWIKRKLSSPSDAEFPETFFGATRQTHKLHPLPGLSAENCTEQMGEPGPWYERLPHFRLDYTPSAGAELQTEYLVPLSRGYQALQAVGQLGERIAPLLLISELRTIAADDLPMSMAYQRDSLAIHFTWKQELAPVLALLPAIEKALEPFAARPHWGKLFTIPGAEVRALYPRFEDFLKLVREYDPQGRFRNAFLNDLLG